MVAASTRPLGPSESTQGDWTLFFESESKTGSTKGVSIEMRVYSFLYQTEQIQIVFF